MKYTTRTVRDVVEDYFQALRTADTTRLADFISADFTDHSFPEFSGGPAGVRRAIEWLHQTFADLEHTLEDFVSNDDSAAVRVISTGKHIGVLSGKAPTHKRVTWAACDFIRVRDGKITDLWSVQATLSLRRCIGALSPG